MDFTAMQGRVRMILDEDTASFWSDVQVKAEINDAQLIVARNTEELYTFADITTSDDEWRYQLPTDYLKMKYVEIEKSDDNWQKLRFLTQKEWSQYTEGASGTKGTPEIYKLELGSVDPQNSYPGDVWVYPHADTNGPETGGHYTLRLHYYQIPTALSASDDISELPELAHKAVVYLATANLLLRSKELTKSDRMEAKYEREMAELRKHYSRLQRDKVATYTDVMGYGKAQW